MVARAQRLDVKAAPELCCAQSAGQTLQAKPRALVSAGTMPSALPSPKNSDREAWGSRICISSATWRINSDIHPWYDCVGHLDMDTPVSPSSARRGALARCAGYFITAHHSLGRDFISSHPGGDVILNAAGGSIDPFWKIFNIHHKQYVYDILEQYRVGVIDPTDLVNGEVPSAVIDDPFEKDPTRDARMLMHTEKPCNAEPPGEVLNEFLTPNELFFVRNHLWVPDVSDPEEHEVTIVTFDGDEVTFTVRELRQIFKEHSVTAVLQCSGNRRSHMSKQGGDTQGLPWDVGAIGNAKWTGVLLRDVLREVGLDVNEPPEDVQHVQFLGSEAYGASIPIDKAVDRRGDVLLVYQMNDQPLPKDHGAPLRVLVPGHVAARSVKWVKKIILSDEESQSQWQQRDYKCFGPNIKNDPDWSSAPAIQEMPVQSAVTAVRSSGSKISKGADRTNVISTHDADSERTILEGYAFSGGGRTIVRVDVSTDGGRTWDQAELLASPSQGSKSWCWQRWQYSVPAGAVGEGFLVKAVDEAYNTQPEGYGPNWNFRGNLTCGWQRVPANKPEEPQGR
ncbi:hypothetical protein FH972_024591 [Carpinus fangiana]|uniref:Cytochrome b5 heme-binding domain-containing protein n=1 Tax=Carpinus fangiana TaxID=176857 RepID=A0A5N6KZC8_9ROSI|nr:hypothetical protein FH972_024591 [Carpinus fangiana]